MGQAVCLTMHAVCGGAGSVCDRAGHACGGAGLYTVEVQTVCVLWCMCGTGHVRGACCVCGSGRHAVCLTMQAVCDGEVNMYGACCVCDHCV